MCTVLLPSGDNPIALNKYINIIYALSKVHFIVGQYPRKSNMCDEP